MKPNRKIRTGADEIYFVTSATAGRTPFFRYDRWCLLFIEVLYNYREEKFHLFEFVLMPDHFHLMIAPKESLERAMQFIKGGFARRASLQFETKQPIWQRGFTDHRIRDLADYEQHKQYIRMNPEKARLCASASQYPYSSASGRYELDPLPQGLKPPGTGIAGGTAKAVPFPVLGKSGIEVQSHVFAGRSKFISPVNFAYAPSQTKED